MAPKTKKSEEIQRRIPHQKRAREKYEAVLDACSRVLSSMPYEKITMTEISLECGLPYSTIYQYFGNKEEVMEAWMVRVFDQISQIIVFEKGSREEGDLSAQIDNLVKTSLMAISLNQDAMRELLTGMTKVLTTRLLKIAEDRTVELVLELFADTVRKFDQHQVTYQIRMLTRILFGYFIQTILSGKEGLDVERDSVEISLMVKSYLSRRGFLNL